MSTEAFSIDKPRGFSKRCQTRMRMFGSIRIPGLGPASSSPWFWVGFLGTLAAILLAAMFWLALHRPA